MALISLPGSVSGFAKKALLLELLFAIVAQPRAHAKDTPAPSCPGIAESNEFSDNLKRRLQLRNRLCDSRGELKTKLLDPTGKKLGLCQSIARMTGNTFSADPVNKMSDRYVNVCDRYKWFVEKSLRICSSYAEIKKIVPSPAGDINGLEAMKEVNSTYRRLVCGYGLLERTVATGEGVSKFGDRKDKSATDADFTASKDTIIGMITGLPAAVEKSISTGPSQNKFTEAQLAEIRRAVAICQSAQKDLMAFDDVYQKSIYQELLRMEKDAEAARKYFSGKKDSFLSMHQELSQRIGTSGAIQASDPADPIRVRPSAPGSSDPIISQCPADSELTPVEQNLKKAVQYAEKSNGEVGTTFRATTIGPDGKPIYHEVTAAHVVLEDLHDPANERLADLKGAPAGQSMSASEPKAFENTPATLDRAHDVATAPAGIGPGLPVKADDVNPRPGQEFTLAGHPVHDYDSNYVNMTCTFMGYGAGAHSGYYVMDCPTANSSAGGMSGGPMVDPKTGYVWGVATNQGGTYDSQDRLLYRDNRVFVSPIQQGADGRIMTGPQRYDSGYCYYVEGTIPQPCYVTPMGITFF